MYRVLQQIKPVHINHVAYSKQVQSSTVSDCKFIVVQPEIDVVTIVTNTLIIETCNVVYDTNTHVTIVVFN